MKKITITVDDATLARLEILRSYYWSNNSALIRKAIYDLDKSIRGNVDYYIFEDDCRAKHPELFGGS